MTAVTADTSVLVPALLGWHEAHGPCRAALDPVEVLPAHVVVECYSVLTRLPPPQRVGAAQAADVLRALPFGAVGLPPEAVPALVVRLGAMGVGGGATYDALVGATAARHGLALLTRDRRAARTYEAVGVEHVPVA